MLDVTQVAFYDTYPGTFLLYGEEGVHLRDYRDKQKPTPFMSQQ